MHNVLNRGSRQYLLKQDEIIYDGSTNTSVDSYADIMLFPNVAYIPNNVEYSQPIIVEPDDTIVIASLGLGTGKKWK